MSTFDVTRRHAIAMAAIPSVNGTAGELDVVRYLYDYLRDSRACREGLVRLHLVPCQSDRLERQVLVAHVRGRGPRGVVLLGHVDTVGVEDYGAFASLAFDPEGWTAEIARGALGTDLAARAQRGGWLFGRGLLDMKAGVAAALVAFEVLVDQDPAGHLLFVATPDEEVGSLGVLTLIPWINEYARAEGFQVDVVVNTDYTAARPNDAGAKPIYLGSIGKLLGGVYVQGRPSHVGEPEFGFDPNAIVAAITHRVVYSSDLIDKSGEESTPVPVSLYQRDDKPVYDVQTAASASAYYNLFHFNRPPSEQLQRLVALTAEGVASARAQYGTFAPAPNVPVYTFEHLWREASTELRAEIAGRHSVAVADLRDQSRRIVADLVQGLKLAGPLVVVHFATGLIPAVTSGDDARRAVEATIGEWATTGMDRFVIRQYYPYISDLSFLGPSPDWDDDAFTRNFPPRAVSPAADRQYLESATIMVGTYGSGAHRIDEGVDAEYTFGRLPRVLTALVRQLWTDVG